MAYSTPYDYNEDSIRQLDEKFSEIEHDRFLYCIQEQQKWDIEKVNNFIAQLRTSHLYACAQGGLSPCALNQKTVSVMNYVCKNCRGQAIKEPQL